MPLTPPALHIAHAALLLVPFMALSAQRTPTPRVPFAAGVRALTIIDSSRRESRSSAAGRPLFTMVWYPARRRASPRRPTTDELAARASSGLESGTPSRASWLTGADLDAPVASGTFPVVLYAPGSGGPAYENATLFEALASRGFVVLSSPSTGPEGPMSPTVDGLEAQAGDLAALSRYAKTLHYADASRVVAMGFSWGGMANLLAAMRQPEIRATISLDGSVSYFFESVFSRIPDAAPERLIVPSLFLLSDADALPASARASSRFAFFERLNIADHYAFELPPLRHRDFSESGRRSGRTTNAPLVADSAAVARGARQVQEIVLAFLSAYIHRDAASRRQLRSGARAFGVQPSHARVRLPR